MTCRQAEHFLASSDANPAAGDLDVHLRDCLACRQRHAALQEGLRAWRDVVMAGTVPDPVREWHAVRRARRQQGPESPVPLRWLAWAAAPLTAAAAIALLVLVPPAGPSGSPARPIAHAGPAPAAPSSAVFVDAQSGWTVVWASEPSPAVGL